MRFILALFVISFHTSISGLMKAEMFLPEVRALGVRLCYAVDEAMFGVCHADVKVFRHRECFLIVRFRHVPASADRFAPAAL